MARASYCRFDFIFLDSAALSTLSKAVQSRLQAALRPRTSRAYQAGFRLFVSFMVKMNLMLPHKEETVLLYLEFLAQNGLKACSLRNHLSILGHYFALYNWPVQALCAKKVSMLVKSVHIDARMQVRIKGIFSPELLKKLILKMKRFTNHATYVALCLVSFFGFFRLGSLCPDNLSGFDRTRFPALGDVIWGPPGAHIVITCSKTMQKSGAIHVVQLPLLKDSILCPVMALKEMIKILAQDKEQPLFMIKTKAGKKVLTSFKARSFLKMVVVALGLNPKHYSFHAFRRSGASLAFNSNVDLDKIKQHGSWKSEAVWVYLNSTPKAASMVPTTFQQVLSYP